MPISVRGSRCRNAKVLLQVGGLSACLLGTLALSRGTVPAQAKEATRQPAPRSSPLTAADLTVAERLRDEAMRGTRAYAVVESLTTEVGPRLAGTPGDALGVAWAVRTFESLGYDRVWTEPVTYPVWKRGVEQAEVVSPFPQRLVLTALGGSVGTPPGGLTGEIVAVESYSDLEKAETDDPALRDRLRDKIVFIRQRMERHRDGSGYGPAVRGRAGGPALAGKLGAKALLIRSIGTDSSRHPHTGGTFYADPNTPRIPAAALSNPDADLLSAMLERGKPVQVKLELGCAWSGEHTSANVLAEVTGRERPEEMVLLGAHLDSWDLGTGAIDDASGVAITMTAGALIAALPPAERPRRTIRVVAFANEEQGLHGGRAYFERHQASLHQIVVGAESDFGAGRVYGFGVSQPLASWAATEPIRRLLRPIGVSESMSEAAGGPDLHFLHQAGAPMAELEQDGTSYFDVHHTADDTLDKVKPADLDQNVAAYVTFAYLAAQAGRE